MKMRIFSADCFGGDGTRSFWPLFVILALLFPWHGAQAQIFSADPATYRSMLGLLKPGDTLSLRSGTYEEGLSITRLHGRAGEPVIITGPEEGFPAIFLGSQNKSRNTIQIKDSSYVTVRNLKLDGMGIADIDAVNARGITHHITIENLKILRYGGSQLTVGIATRGPAWNWVIRKNLIVGAGTGMYLGNSNGAAPFVAGLIEGNVVLHTLGYNLQIKHQKPRPQGVGFPKGQNTTIIRHNVFSKAENAAMNDRWARPNVLLGHWPLRGEGQDDQYLVYGNFFYQNPSEALFQGEGHIAFYNNLLVNDVGSALNIQKHNDKPRRIDIFQNTIVARNTGIRVQHGVADYAQRVVANAVFASTPLRLTPSVQKQDNFAGTYRSASSLLGSPRDEPGELDFFPKPAKLRGSPIDMSPFMRFEDWGRDFDGAPRSGMYRGAYEGGRDGAAWFPELAQKPLLPNVPVKQGRIEGR
ncbi:MAG: right-handed parallel beta-helix repeat-containing protein [Gammaproteobacteria bacterium]|nr:right-handed parallel beta-helix repeat-containing protein [Gammaproteobacteria bacterium]